MATRKTYLVIPHGGLNLRAQPRKDAAVIGVLPRGLRICINTNRKAPEGWVAVDDIGYVQLVFLK